MNAFLSILFALALQGSALDDVRSLETAIRNLPANAEINATLTIRVKPNDTTAIKVTTLDVKEVLSASHREIMRQALIDATHD